MSPLRKALFLAIPLSFAIGAYQGRKLFDARARKAAQSALPRVRVLAYEGLFSEAFLRAAQDREGLAIEIETARSPDELLAKLEADPGRYDLAALFHWQLPRAAPRLARIDGKGALRGPLDRVSPDFRDLQGASAARVEATPGLARRTLVPLIWGAVGFIYDRARLGGALTSWAQAFARPGLRKKIRLLASPIDLAYLADARASLFPSTNGAPPAAARAARAAKKLAAQANARLADPDEEGDAPIEAGGDAGETEDDEGLARLRRPLAQLGDLAAIEGGPWRTGLAGPGPDAPPVVQMSQGEAAFWLASPAGKDWAFEIPEEGGLIWTLGLAFPQAGAAVDPRGALERRESAEKFAAFALDREGVAAVVEAARAASANRLAEELPIDFRLKPSYAREIPLTRVRAAPAFESGGAVLTMLHK